MPSNETVTPETATPRHRDRAARVAVEELTGLALQERALTTLLARHAAEAPLGGPRERLERHVRQSREHAGLFDDRVAALRSHRGGGELALGLFRSGLAALGVVGAAVGQLASAPFVLVRRGGGEERLLENTGVEGAALANKLVILTAVRQALALSGDTASHDVVDRVREETVASWDELLVQVPELMTALVSARAHEPSFDFRTAGAVDAAFELVGPGASSPRTNGNGNGNGSRSRRRAATAVEAAASGS